MPNTLTCNIHVSVGVPLDRPPRFGATAARILSPVMLAIAISLPAIAQADDDGVDLRTRISIGPQLVPSYPGANKDSVRPFGNVARASGDALLDGKSPDGAIGPELFRTGGLSFGPSINFLGERTLGDTKGLLDRVGTTVEVGGFASYRITPSLWVSVAVRHGIGGHKAWTGTLGADYVKHDADRFLISLGPRLTFADARYNRAYFGVAPGSAALSGLGAYAPGGGLEAIGANLGLVRALSGPWGVYSYAGYNRLVGDAGNSPVVRKLGSRNQISAGIGISYTFGRRPR